MNTTEFDEIRPYNDEELSGAVSYTHLTLPTNSRV